MIYSKLWIVQREIIKIYSAIYLELFLFIYTSTHLYTNLRLQKVMSEDGDEESEDLEQESLLLAL